MAGSLRKRPDKGSDAYELRVYLGRDSGGHVRHRADTAVLDVGDSRPGATSRAEG